MRAVDVKHVVDARAGQGRLILHLSCGHTATIWQADLQIMKPSTLAAIETLIEHPDAAKWPCEACPDASPAEQRQAKTAVQLWKEAGEP